MSKQLELLEKITKLSRDDLAKLVFIGLGFLDEKDLKIIMEVAKID